MVDIESAEVIAIGTDIAGFFEKVKTLSPCEIYFHNLKFDGEFILYYLLTNGYKHDTTKTAKTFDTLITENGMFYSITVYYRRYKRRYIKTVFYDSLKKLPFSVAVIAKTFDIPEKKLSIDYNKDRPPGYELTDEEREYIVNDCVIVAKALNKQFTAGLTYMTIGSDALNLFKKGITEKRFMNWFPVLDLAVDSDIRLSYKGGFSYVNPQFKDRRVSGLVYDVNSLYPSIMYNDNLPFGYPVFFEGKYKPDTFYPLFVQRLRCEFELKPGHIPTIQLKRNPAFIQTEYLTSSKGEIVDITLTSVDYELFRKHYNIYNEEYISGWKFKSCRGVFTSYINYWSEIKNNSSGASRTLAKLMLNSLYGKFATNPRSAQKIPFLFDDIVKYKVQQEDPRNPVYTAVSSFITAYARCKTITAAQSLYDRFIYADTDSLHITGFDPPDLEIGSSLGLWEYEGKFIDGVYLRPKSYIQKINDKLKVVCAGMPDYMKDQVDFNNFTYGTSYSGKLIPKRYPGGIVLHETDFTIKKDAEDLRQLKIKAWEDREDRKTDREFKKQFRRAVMSLGGVNDPDYEYLPRWCKRKRGRPLDELVAELQTAGFWYDNADDLYNALFNY